MPTTLTRRIVAVSMVKDELDVVEFTIRNIARHVDRMIVADNGSTDGTRDLLADLARELDVLEVVDDPEVAYYQAEKMTRLAHAAADNTKCWIVPFDADEVWIGLEKLRDFYDGLAVWVPGYDYLPPDDLDPHRGVAPHVRMTDRRGSRDSFGPKIIPRWHPDLRIMQGNHGAELHSRRLPTIELPGLEIAHFPLRSFEQFRRKARNGGRAYAESDLPKGWGAHWRKWGAMTDDELEVEWRARRHALLYGAEVVHDPVLARVPELPS